MIETEKLITLKQAILAVPGTGHPSAAWRWIRRGVLGRNGERIFLEGVRAGGKLLTSAEAVQRFFAAVAAADAEHFRDRERRQSPRQPTTARRHREIEQARKEMKEAGF